MVPFSAESPGLQDAPIHFDRSRIAEGRSDGCAGDGGVARAGSVASLEVEVVHQLEERTADPVVLPVYEKTGFAASS